MKQRILLLLLPLLLALGAQAQTTLLTEGFAVQPGTGTSKVDVANTTSYTTAATTGATAVTSNNNSYFVRATNGPPPADVTNPSAPFTFPSTSQNAGVPAGGTFPTTDTFFWIGEGVRGPANVFTRTPGILQLLPLTVTSYTGLQVKIGFVDLRNTGINWENNDTIKIQTRFNGTGAWVTAGQFVGDNANTGSGGRLRQDTNLDGKTYDVTDAGISPFVTSPMSDFTFNVSGTGTTMQVRVVYSEEGLSEELAFDNIRVLGTLNSSSPPVLASIEGTTINYAEGAAAVQITNALTIADTDNTTLSGATVRIIGFDASEDRLLFTNQNGITGSYANATGILTLSGTATLAAYQAALRSVRFQDIDAIDAFDGTRTIQFTVTDASAATSSTVTRNILVTSSLDAAAALPYIDDLEADGEGTRFKSNQFIGSNGAAFFRTNVPNNNANPNGPWYANGASQTNFTGMSPTGTSYYWYSGGPGNAANPALTNVGTFVTKQMNAASYANLHFKILLGATTGAWDDNDYTKLYYRANGGSWVIFASFRSTVQAVNATGNMARDADPTNLTSAPTGTVLGPAMAQFDFALPAALNGQQVDFMIEEQSQDAGGNGETFIFDKIEVNGTLLAAPTVTTAAAGSVTINSALLGGNITADGGASLTERGVVYVVGTGTPTTSNTKALVLTTGVTTGAFSGTVSGLAPGTQYTVRAYAINSAGTSYGSSITFTTSTITLAPASPLTAGTVAAAYSQTITASGGTAPYSYAITAGALPAGLTLSSAGVLSGTPTAGGTFSFTVTATDASAGGGPYTGARAYSLTIAAPTITVAPTTLTGGTVATAYSQTITASGGTAPYTYAITSGALPAGLTLSSAGVLSGTPTAGGSFTFTVTATDASTGSGPYTGSRAYTLTIAAPTITVAPTTLPNGATATAYSQTISASGGTAPYTYAITSGALPAGLTLSSAGLLSGTPTASGPFTFTVTATDASTGSGPYTGARAYSLTIVNSSTTVSSVTRLTPSPTATATVSFRVVFAASVSGVSVSNFSLTTTGSIAGASVSSASGSGTTYTVAVNTGTGDGTLRLNVANSTGISPAVSNVPYTAGEVYTIIKNFSAAPQLVLRGAGSASGSFNDVTAFVDSVKVLRGAFTVRSGLQNNSFETNNVATNSFRYATTVVAAPWSFSGNTGVSRNSSGFGSTANQGTSVGLLQTSGGNGGSIAQNLAVPTGSYQVNFQAVQRGNNGPSDQVVNVFLNNGTTDVYLGAFQAPSNNTYSPFTSATFSVTAPALTASITSTATNPTGTSPIPVTVTFSQAATGFTASDVTVGNGTISGFSGSGTTYTFNVTPAANGPVTVDVAASVAQDANNTDNTAASQFSITYTQPVTAAPVVTTPANGSLTNDNTPTYGGTAPAGSTVTVYVDGTALPGTATADGAGNWAIAQPTALAQGSHTVRATAQTSGSAVSVDSNTNTFTVDTVRPMVAITSTGNTNGGGTGTSPVPFTVTFSENVTGFVAGDVTVNNGTISGFAGTSPGTVFTFNVTPTTSGTATTVNVPANVAQDAAGNFNTAATQFSITYTQPVTATPVVTTPAHVSLTNDNTPTYAGTAPAGSTVTVYVDGSSIGTTTATAGGSWSLTQPTALTDATHTVNATAQTSGSAVSATSNTNGFTVDATAPTVSITSTASSPTSTSPIPVTVTFSEFVAGFVAGDVTVSNGTLSNFSGSSPTYTFDVTPAGNGPVTVNVAANVAADAASNGNTAAPQFSITYTQPVTAAPVATTPANGSVTADSTPAYGGTAPAGSTVTVYVDGSAIGTTTATGGSWSLTQPTALADGSHTVFATAQTSGSAVSANSNTNTFTVDTAAPTTALTATPANPSNSSSASFSFTGTDGAGSGVASFQAKLDGGSFAAATSPHTYTGLSDGSHTFQVRAIDAAGNVDPTPASYTWTIDTSSPSVNITSTASNPTSTSPIPMTATFSEAVTGFAAADVVPTNGTVGNFAGSGTTYTFEVTPTTGGTVAVNIAAGAAQDAAGNDNTATAFALTYVVPAAGWNGSVSTDWFTAANWTPATVPTATLDAVIPAGAPRYPTISAGTATAQDLTIDAGASLTMNGSTLDVRRDWTNNGTFTAPGGTVALNGAFNQTVSGSSLTRFWNLRVSAAGATLGSAATVQRLLTLNGNLTTSGQTFTLESNTTLTAMVVNSGGVVVGNATVQRAITSANTGLGYRHYSSPVSNSTVGDLTTAGYTPVVNNNYNTSAAPLNVTPFPTVYGYDQGRMATAVNNLDNFSKGWVSPVSLASPLVVGQGYSVNISAAAKVDFVGTLNNSDVTQALARTSGATAADGGWQLLGNPYPAPLDYSLVAPADRSNLDAAIYVFESNSPYQGVYRSYVNGIGNPVLPLGQGFFTRVSAGQTSGSLTLRNSHRLTTPNATTFRRGAADTRPLVQLDLQGSSGATDALHVYFEQGASAGFDAAYDAAKLPNTTGLNLAAVAIGQNVAINGLPALGTAQVTVPLTVQVPATGTYTLHAAQLLNLGTTHAYLRDRQTGALVDLNVQPSYVFTLNAAYTGVRFELVFAPQSALATAPASLSAQVAVFPNPAHRTAFVELPAGLVRTAATADLVDALGRTVRTYALPAGLSTHALPLADVATGVYSLRVATAQGTVTKKLVVE